MPGGPEPASWLSFDFGRRKIGVAVGETLTESARPLTTLACGKNGVNWREIDDLIATWRPAGCVVGLPLTLDGGDQSITQDARAFAKTLSKRSGLPVELHDERMTSLAARDEFARRRRDGRARRNQSASLDALSAKLILESWFVERVKDDRE